MWIGKFEYFVKKFLRKLKKRTKIVFLTVCERAFVIM